MSEDYYALLGVEPDASEEAILQAYREKAAEHHPDVSAAADAEATFQRLNRAKDVLTDAERRRQYDRVGHDRFVEQAGKTREPRREASGPSRRGPVRTEKTGTSAGVRDWPSGFRSMLEQLFGGVGSPRAGAEPEAKGESARYPPGREPFTVDLETLFRRRRATSIGYARGASTDPSARTARNQRECPKCRGRGSFEHVIDTGRSRRRRLEPCERCGGTGTVSE